jgi:hypothetical protein
MGVKLANLSKPLPRIKHDMASWVFLQRTKLSMNDSGLGRLELSVVSLFRPTQSFSHFKVYRRNDEHFDTLI